MPTGRVFIGYGSTKLSFSRDGKILSTGSTVNGMGTQYLRVVLLLHIINAVDAYPVDRDACC